MAVRVLGMYLSSVPNALTDLYFQSVSLPEDSRAAALAIEAADIPYRQLLFSAYSPGGVLGTTSSGVLAGVAVKVPLPTAAPLVLGPFNTGPVKLGDLWAVGAGVFLVVLGVPF